MNFDVGVIIPFRDRGIDPLRKLNLERVKERWMNVDLYPQVFSDGREGGAQFNRSAAYNIGRQALPNCSVYVFAESDMLISKEQIDKAIDLALEKPGLVVPFDQYRYLSEKNSEAVLHWDFRPEDVVAEHVMLNGRSIGAINVVSQATMKLVGQWDETFEGSWYDDDAMKIAFEMVSNPTRWVKGPAHHLYHLPGWKGKHLTADDRHATRRNKLRLGKYKLADSPGRIRELVKGGM